MERLLRVLKEDVRMVESCAVKVEKAKGQFVLRRRGEKPMRCSEAHASGGLREKDRDAGDEQSARKPLDDGIEQRVDIGFGAQSAAELNQGLPVVVLLPVKGLVNPPLDAALEWIEDRGGHQDGDHKCPPADRRRKAVVDHLSNEGDDTEVAAEQRRRGEGVGYAALEDQVGVHQPVANDGPAEGERK